MEIVERYYFNDAEEKEPLASFTGISRWSFPSVSETQRKQYCPGHPDWEMEYRVNGELHREDGPAIEYSTGEYAWVIHNEFLTFEKFMEEHFPKLNSGQQLQILFRLDEYLEKSLDNPYY